jgi:uncharacterized RDD family membrane protein YckC
MEQGITGPQGAPEMNYARRLVRFAAFVVDVIVISVVMAILDAVGLTNTFSAAGDPATMEGAFGSTRDAVIQAIVGLVYFVVLTTLFGATLGKMALRVRVANTEGATPPFGKVALREFIKGGVAPVPYVLGAAFGSGVVVLVFVVVVFWVLIDDRRQGLHDKAAETFVIRAE